MAAREPGPGRQDLRDMAAPAGRVFAVPVSPRLGGISTVSIRPRMRLAVSGLSCQIGSKILSTCAVPMSATGNSPMTG